MYNSIWNSALKHLSEDRMKADIASFFELSRWSSYDKLLTLARRIAVGMEEAGLEDVSLIEFPADGKTFYGGWVLPKAYEVEDARLAVVQDGAEMEVLADYHQNPTSLMLYSMPTPSAGITANLAIADSLADFTPDRCSGRLVLTRGLGVEYSQAAMKAGAPGIISDCRAARAFIKDGPHLEETNEWHNYTIPPWEDPHKGFGFSISPQLGRRLRSQIASDETVQLHALVKTRHYDGILPVISGRLPGRTPEEIAITGHYDEYGADDNCSQVAVALEAIRAVRAMLEAGEIPPLERTVRIMLPMEVRGFNALIQDPAQTRHLRAGLNIDTVGTDQNAVTSFCNLVDNFSALPSFAEELAAELLDRVAAENPLFRWKRSGGETIDNIFGEPLIGAPTPCIYHYSATHHLALDTPDRISGRMLLDMARLTTTYAAFLANAGLPEALWLAELTAEKGIHQLQEVSGRALRGNLPAPALLRQVQALQESYHQKINSARWLLPSPEGFPSPDALAQGDYPALGENRLFPVEIYHQKILQLQEQLATSGQEAQAAIHRRFQEFFQAGITEEEEQAVVSRCIPLKAFRGFLAFEDLSPEEGKRLAELGTPQGWGAPMWLQEALMFANGKRTAGEIAALVYQYTGRRLEVRSLEEVFHFLAERGLIRLRPFLTQAQIKHALEEAGLETGDLVLGHFSLSRYGYIEDGANGLIETLLQVIGPTGTLVMPTFTFSWLGRPPYHPASTLSRVGAVTDRFWRLPGVQRSSHPTHSFAAIGQQAQYLLEGHDHTKSPLSQDGPLGKLQEMDGKILMFAPLLSNTSMHLGDYQAGIPLQSLFCPIGDKEVLVPDCPWHVRFALAYDKLYSRGLIRDIALGENQIHTMKARDAIAAQSEVARESPVALLQPGCNCQYCQQLKEYCSS